MTQTPPATHDDWNEMQKEVKLHLPIKTHVQLHRAKLLRNMSIQASIVSAIAAYFENHPVDPTS